MHKKTIKKGIDYVGGLKSLLVVIGIIGTALFTMSSKAIQKNDQINDNTVKADTALSQIKVLQGEHSKNQKEFLDTQQQLLEFFKQVSANTNNKLDSLLDK